MRSKIQNGWFSIDFLDVYPINNSNKFQNVTRIQDGGDHIFRV
jgi:hypothetical protein